MNWGVLGARISCLYSISYRDGEESLTGSILKTVRVYTKHTLKGEQDFTG